MKRPPPLRYTIPIALLIGATIIGLSSYAYNIHTATSEIIESATREARELHRLRNALEYALQRNDQDQASRIVAELGATPEIISSHLVDNHNTIIAATQLAEVGGRYIPPAIFNTSPSGPAPIFIIDGTTLYSRYRITLARTADEIRPSRTGDLYIESDMSRNMIETHHYIEVQAITFGGFLILIALLLWLYLHKVIAQRIDLLKKATQQIGEGNLHTRVMLTPGDELGDLGQNFNLMARQLEEQQSHLRALQQALDEHAIVSITDISGRISYVNDRFCKASRYNREELLGQNHRILKSAAHTPEFYEELWETISTGNVWQGVIQNCRKDGTPYWVQSTIVPITDEQHRPIKYISVRTDVTQREQLRQAMEQLATAAIGDEFYNAISSAIAVGLDCRWAGIGLLTGSDLRIRIVGFIKDGKPQDDFECTLTNTPCGELCAKQDSLLISDNLDHIYPNHKILNNLGAVSFHGEPLFDEERKVIGMIFAMNDKPFVKDESNQALLHLATKRIMQEIRRAEANQSLNKNQIQLAAAQRMANIGSWTLEYASNTLQWSDEVFRIVGVDKSRFTPSYQRFIDSIHPDDRAMVTHAYTTSVETQTPYSIIHRLLMSDGKIKWVHERGETYYDNCGKPLHSIGYIHDITERKLVEQERSELLKQLQQAQKMEAIGQLTGGIAHDFNNILTSMTGFIELTLKSSRADNNTRIIKYMEHAMQAGMRARDLVSQMLAFGRARPGEQQSVSAHALIKEVTKLLAPTMPSSIKLELNIEKETPPLLADPVQLHQVVTNLVINARDAVGEHGKIEIELSGPKLYESNCGSCHQHFSGNFIEITVRDNGHGIPTELQERIFEPFFTTKSVGKGSGMGLAMVHGILHQCGGHILLQSTPESGTCFRLLLPQATVTLEKHISPSEKNYSPDISDSHNREIMIVDDEPSVSAFIAELLQAMGYRTTEFNSANLALQSFHAEPQKYDLIITDQTMPELTGGELATALLKQRPNLPIILCTGYSTTLDEASALEIGIGAYINKPFSSQKLLDSIATLLRNKPTNHK